MKKVTFAVSAALLMLFTVCLLLFVGGEERVKLNAEEIFREKEQCCFYVKVYGENGYVKNYGSGFFVSPDGLAVTAYHVVKGGAKINVMFADESTMTNIPVVWSDYTSDIALLKLDVKDVSYLKVEENAIPHGARVYAMGYPFRESKIITDGIVANPAMKLNESVRTVITAPLVNGMSGGPILNEYGNVSGVASGSVFTMPGLYVSPTTHEINNAINNYREGIK